MVQVTIVTTKTITKLLMTDIEGYGTVTYDDKWRLDYVLGKPDVIWTLTSEILCKVDPTTLSGRMQTNKGGCR